MWTGYSEKGTGSQERGPGSFALEVPGAPRAQAPGGGGVQQVRAGVQGGFTQPTGNIVVPDAAPDPTMAALLKIGEQAVQPELERIRTEQFVKGMQQAASGAAMADIVNEQPWYTQLFGPGAAVQGARAYTASASAARFGEQIMGQMETLRRQPPDSVPGFLVGQIKNFQTGDPDSDLLVQGELMKLVPNIVKIHTKEHIKWTQEHAAETRLESWRSNAELLRQTHRSTAASVEDLDAADVGFLSALPPSFGESDDSYGKALSEFVVELSAKGNFPALEALRRATVLDKIDPRVRAQVEQNVQRLGKEEVGKLAPKYAEDLWKVMTDTTATPDERVARLGAINAAAASESGVPPSVAQLLSPALIARAVDTGLDQQLRAKTVAERLAAKAREDAAEVESAAALDAAVASFLVTDHGGEGAQRLERLQASGVKEKDIDRVFGKVWDSQADPRVKAAMVRNFPGYKPPQAVAWLRDRFDTVNYPGTDPEAGAKALRDVATFSEGLTDSSQQDRLFSAQELEDAKLFASYLRSGSDDITAFKQVRTARPIQAAIKKPIKKDSFEQALVNQLAENLNAPVQAFFGVDGKHNLPDEQRQIAYGIVSQLDRISGPDDVVAKNLVARATDPERPLFEVMGKYAVVGASINNPLAAYAKSLAATPAEVNPIIGVAIEDKLKAAGVDTNTALVMRESDNFIITGYKDAKPVSIILTGDEVIKRVDAARITPKVAPPVRSGVERKGNPVQQMLRNNKDGTPIQ